MNSFDWNCVHTYYACEYGIRSNTSSVARNILADLWCISAILVVGCNGNFALLQHFAPCNIQIIKSLLNIHLYDDLMGDGFNVPSHPKTMASCPEYWSGSVLAGGRQTGPTVLENGTGASSVMMAISLALYTPKINQVSDVDVVLQYIIKIIRT